MGRGVNIIEVQSKIPKNVYYVRKSWSNPESQIKVTRDMDEAIRVANNAIGYYVYDSSGKVVHIPHKKTTTVKPRLKPGSSIMVKALNVYRGERDSIPARAYSGPIKFIDNGLHSGKYHVEVNTVPSDMYVLASDISKYF